MRRWALAAVLAVLVTVGGGWGEPRSSGGPARGAGPASVDLALPAGVAQLALTSRAHPRDPAPLAALPQGPAGSGPGRRPGRTSGPLGRPRPRRGRRIRRPLPPLA